jgi:1-acyl-sn-glycerol-3-phosphate acyltransferase
MRERLDYARRWCATAFSFFLFGAVGVLLWGLVFPGLAPLLGRGEILKRRAHRLMYAVFRAYVELMRVLGIFRYEVHGGERLHRPGRLVVANHPSLLDVVFLVSFIPNATCIVKPALVRNPFMRIPIRAVHYIYADDPESLLEECAREMREGASLVIFPEGTRATPGQPRQLQRGAANIALAAGAPILPVYIDCRPSMLTKRDKWYRIPERRVRFRFFVGEEIDPAGLTHGQPRSLASRALTRRLHEYFAEQDELHGNS